MPEEKKENKLSEADEQARAKASKNGWSDSDKWKGDLADWVDYREFNLRGEYMDRIQEQSSIINHLTNKVSDRDLALKDMQELSKKISDNEYKKALKDLQDKKVVALDADDYQGIVNLDEQISDLKDHKPVAQDLEEDDNNTNQVPQEIIDWMAKPENNWYHTDETLKAIADGISNSILQKNQNIPPATLIKQVEKKLKEELPHRFNNDNNENEVDPGSAINKSNKGKHKPTWDDLDDNQKECATRFERIGLMKKDEYIQSLVDSGEL